MNAHQIAGLMIVFSIVLPIILIVRNMVASRICQTANNALRAYLEQEARAGRANIAVVAKHYDRLGKLSYDAVLFNLLIWTPRQAYPWLYELIDAQKPVVMRRVA